MTKFVNLGLASLTLLMLAACGGSGTVRPEPDLTFQATAGFHQFRNNNPINSYFFFHLDLGADGGTADVSVTGPAGWNGNQPRELGTFASGVHEVFQPVTAQAGTYTLHARTADVTLTATTVVDTLLRMPLFTGFTAVAAENGVAADWNPLAGAVSYHVRLEDMSREIQLVEREGPETSVVLPIALSELNPATEYRVTVFASTHHSNASDNDFSRQFFKTADWAVVQLPQ